MTDHHDPLDDLASAHLDDPAHPGAIDDELRLRIERLGAAREALRASAAPPIDPVERDRAIAAALAAFDEEPAGGDPIVVPLRPHRRRPARLVELVGIAAAIVALALVVPLLGRLGSGSPDDVAVAPTVASIPGAASGGASSDPAPNAMALDSAASPSIDLGSFAEVDALAAAVRARLDEARRSVGNAETTAGAYSDGSACAEERAAGGDAALTATATLEGRPVIVIVHETPTGRTLVVLASDDCSTISRHSL